MQQRVNPFKMLLISMMVITIVMTSTVFASAEAADIQVMSRGDAVLPYFEINQAAAFCLESVVARPTEDCKYFIGEAYENESVLRLIKNYIALQGTVDNELLNQVMQQAIWATLDQTTTQRVLVMYRLGQDGAVIYDNLVNGEFVTEDAKVIKMTVYFEETSQYQKLMSWVLEDVPKEDAPPEETSVEPEGAPEDSTKEPAVSEEPKTLPEDTPEESLPEELTIPEEPEKISVEHENAPEKISEVPSLESNTQHPKSDKISIDVTDESKYVENPKTGDMGSVTIYGISLISSAMGIQKFRKKNNK